MNNIAPQSPVMRRLTLQDNPAIARVIRQVSAEYGLTADKGYTVADPNLDELYQVYSQPGHAYWVVEYEGEVVGGVNATMFDRYLPFSCPLNTFVTDAVRF
ncbi:TPA: N-acetyltransferase family protein, partial [Escherichia coli]